MSDKIKPHHLGRKAILYVRQSSAHQVTHNQESRILQYAMRDRLCDLGWREIVTRATLTTINVIPLRLPAMIQAAYRHKPRSHIPDLRRVLICGATNHARRFHN